MILHKHGYLKLLSHLRKHNPQFGEAKNQHMQQNAEQTYLGIKVGNEIQGNFWTVSPTLVEILSLMHFFKTNIGYMKLNHQGSS